MAIQTNDPKITLVAGGYSLFVNGKIAGGIGVGGGTGLLLVAELTDIMTLP